MGSSNTIEIKCVYCGHTWAFSPAALEKQRRVIYRNDPDSDSPSQRVEYLVQCPRCHRRLVIAVEVRGESKPKTMEG